MNWIRDAFAKFEFLHAAFSTFCIHAVHITVLTWLADRWNDQVSSQTQRHLQSFTYPSSQMSESFQSAQWINQSTKQERQRCDVNPMVCNVGSTLEVEHYLSTKWQDINYSMLHLHTYLLTATATWFGTRLCPQSTNCAALLITWFTWDSCCITLLIYLKGNQSTTNYRHSKECNST